MNMRRAYGQKKEYRILELRLPKAGHSMKVKDAEQKYNLPRLKTDSRSIHMCCPKDHLGVQSGIFGGVMGDPFLTETYPVRPPDENYTQIMLTLGLWNTIFEGDYDNLFQRPNVSIIWV